jgi:hypothetical protein
LESTTKSYACTHRVGKTGQLWYYLAQIAYSTWQALRRVGSSVGMRLSRMFTRIQATPSATSRVSTWRGDEEHECCPSS